MCVLYDADDALHAAVVLTVRGELDEEEEDADTPIEEARLDEEYVRVLTSFDHKGAEIHVSATRELHASFLARFDTGYMWVLLLMRGACRCSSLSRTASR